MLESTGFVLPINPNRDLEFDLFIHRIHSLIEGADKILQRTDLFFCTPEFSGCSWPYITGDGPLCIGFLLIGWRNGLLTEICPVCGGKVCVTFFGGSPLSGSCSWTGACIDCNTKQSAKGSRHRPFWHRIEFITYLRKQFAVREPLAVPLTFEDLISQLTHD